MLSRFIARTSRNPLIREPFYALRLFSIHRRENDEGKRTATVGIHHQKPISDNLMRRNVQLSLLNEVNIKCYDYNPKQFSDALDRLGQLGLKWKDIEKSHQTRLISQIVVLPFPLTEFNLLLRALRNMEYDWKNEQKVYQIVLKRIEEWYGKGVSISALNRHNFPIFLYALSKGKMQWRGLSPESKQALLNGVEAYCKGENVNAKKVSNMIYGLGNMGATIYNSPVLMKELLEGAVRKIAGKDCGPQAVSNIVYSLKEMQYSWELLREETREALFHMIRQSSRDFNAQGLCNTCHSIAVMIRYNKGDWEKSYFLSLQESLLRRYFEIEKTSERMEGAFSEEELSQLSVYLSWLETLPSYSLSSLLQFLQQDKLPDIKFSVIHKPSDVHLRFTERLRLIWRESITACGDESLSSVKFLNEFRGLKRGVFPMDVVVVQTIEGREEKEKVLCFIEIDGESHRHRRLVSEDGARILDTKDQLKEYLYSHHFPEALIKRYIVKDINVRFFNEMTLLVKEIQQRMKS